jgi:hypothetical protein
MPQRHDLIQLMPLLVQTKAWLCHLSMIWTCIMSKSWNRLNQMLFYTRGSKESIYKPLDCPFYKSSALKLLETILVGKKMINRLSITDSNFLALLSKPWGQYKTNVGTANCKLHYILHEINASNVNLALTDFKIRLHWTVRKN